MASLQSHPQQTMLPLRLLRAAVLALALVGAAAAPPGRGENCDIYAQGRGECADGLICRTEDDQAHNVCQDPLEKGAICSDVDEDVGLAGCKAGLYCSQFECVPAKEVGDACERDAECGIGVVGRCGLYGSGPTCVELADESEPCWMSSDCVKDLACFWDPEYEEDAEDSLPGICKPRLSDDESCNFYDQCLYGLQCGENDTCQALYEDGEACEYSAQCAGNLICDTGLEQCYSRPETSSKGGEETEDDENPTASPPVVTKPASSTPSYTDDEENDGGTSGKMIAIAAGAGGAGFIALLAAVTVILCCCCRNRNEDKEEEDTVPTPAHTNTYV